MMKRLFTAAVTLLSGISTGTAQTVLTLEQATEMARQNNRTLQNAALEIKMAGEQKKEAYTQYFPQISAQVMAFQSFDKLIKGDGTIPDEVASLGSQFAELAGQPFSYGELNRAYSATLQVMQPLYAGGQIRTGNRLARIGQDVAELQMQLKDKELTQSVTEGYWKIAMVKYNLLTLDASDRQLDEALKTTTVYVDAGLTHRNDLLKVKLRKQELASQRLKLNNAEHVLRLLLAQLVGMAGQDVDINAKEMEAEDPRSLYANSEEAVLKREELQLAQKSVEAQELQIKMERDKLLPNIAVGVAGFQTGFGGLSKNVRDNWDTNITNGLVLGTVSVPISDWWGGTHAVRRQKMKLEQARNDALEAQENLTIDIESAWSSLREAYDQVKLAEQSVEQAEENMQMTADQYRAGTIALSDLLDAETLLRQARTQLATALATYQTQRCDYELKTK